MLLLLLETNHISCLSNIHILHKITQSLLTMSNRSLSPSLIHCTKFDVTCACSLTRYLISAFALFLSHGIDETSLASLEVSTCHPCPAAAMMAGGRPIISTISSSEWWRQGEQVGPPLSPSYKWFRSTNSFHGHYMACVRLDSGTMESIINSFKSLINCVRDT